MTGSTPPDSGAPSAAISRRALLRASLAGGAAIASAPLFGGMPAYASPRSEAASKGKLVIGAFEDGVEDFFGVLDVAAGGEEGDEFADRLGLCFAFDGDADVLGLEDVGQTHVRALPGGGAGHFLS